MSAIRDENDRRLFTGSLLAGLCFATPAEAYIDPGTTGLLSQLLYVLFYGVLGVFLYSLRYVKQIVAKVKNGLIRPFMSKVGDRDDTQSS